MIWTINKATADKFQLQEIRTGTILNVGDHVRVMDDAGKPYDGNITEIGECYFNIDNTATKNCMWTPAALVEFAPPAEKRSRPNTKERGTGKTAQHYIDSRLEPIEVMQRLFTVDEFRGFLKGNVVKYRLRAGHKDAAAKDLKKADQYQHWLNLVTADTEYKIDPIKDSL